jgi:hypothetical protein
MEKSIPFRRAYMFKRVNLYFLHLIIHVHLFQTYCYVSGVCVTGNNGFWIGRLDLLALRLQLQPIITAHNQWLFNTRSIPYWTTSVFSSTVTNDHRRIPPEWSIELPYECRMIELFWTESSSRRTEYKSPCLTVRVILFSCVSPLPRESAYRTVAQQWIIPCLFVAARTCFTIRWLAMDFRCGSKIAAFKSHVTIF